MESESESEFEREVFPGPGTQYIYQGKYADWAIINGVQSMIIKKKQKIVTDRNKLFIADNIKEVIDDLPYLFLRNVLAEDSIMAQILELGIDMIDYSFEQVGIDEEEVWQLQVNLKYTTKMKELLANYGISYEYISECGMFVLTKTDLWEDNEIENLKSFVGKNWIKSNEKKPS
jgi:hypothetical protein